jgi:hypothetical protein
VTTKRIFSITATVFVAVILVISIRAFLIARSEKASAPCINNLRQIAAAENQWVLENSKTTNDVPTSADILPYLRSSHMPVCPDGGTYTIGRVGQPPTCSIGGRGHTLPDGEGK